MSPLIFLFVFLSLSFFLFRFRASDFRKSSAWGKVNDDDPPCSILSRDDNAESRPGPLSTPVLGDHFFLLFLLYLPFFHLPSSLFIIMIKRAISHRIASSLRFWSRTWSEDAKRWRLAREKGRNDSFLSILTIACRHQSSDPRAIGYARDTLTGYLARGTIRCC